MYPFFLAVHNIVTDHAAPGDALGQVPSSHIVVALS